MYSMSMETLKHSAMTPALLKDAADRDMAKELNKACFRDFRTLRFKHVRCNPDVCPH
jgi:hypothetical protein